MANRILTVKGTVIPCQTIRHLTPGELSPANDSEVELRNQFRVATRQKLGDLVSLPPNELDPPIDDPFDMEPCGDDETMMFQIPEADLVGASGNPIIMQLLMDGLINAKVLLPIGDGEAIPKVLQCAVDSEGKLIGRGSSS